MDDYSRIICALGADGRNHPADSKLEEYLIGRSRGLSIKKIILLFDRDYMPPNKY